MKRKWRLWAECGWFSDNPPAGLLVRIFEVIEDCPSGWASITLLGIQVAKFCVSFGVFHD